MAKLLLTRESLRAAHPCDDYPDARIDGLVPPEGATVLQIAEADIPVDVAPHVIRVVGFHRGRIPRGAGEDDVAEAGRVPLDLVFEDSQQIVPVTRGDMAISPGRVCAGGGSSSREWTVVASWSSPPSPRRQATNARVIEWAPPWATGQPPACPAAAK